MALPVVAANGPAGGNTGAVAKSTTVASMPYFTPAEVAAHNCQEDLWLSFLGNVYNITPLIQAHQGSSLVKPLLAAAGKDVSHWFDAATGELRTCIDPITGLEIPFTPHGRFIHVPPACPSTKWATDFGRPWWKDTRYLVGRLSTRTRLVKITNMLSSESQTLEICDEEALAQVQERYEVYNSHSKSYTWKYLGKVLDMNKSLSDNGVPDLSEDFYQLNIDQHEFVPELQVYFNDDLTPP